MADTTALKRRVARWAQQVERNAADSTANRVTKNTPRVNGRMIRDLQRHDTTAGDTYLTKLRQGPGDGDRPDALPNWLDEGRQFVIRARRGRALRFKVGGRVIFRSEVLWNRSRRSQGFWSKSVNATQWERDLRDAAGRTPF